MPWEAAARGCQSRSGYGVHVGDGTQSDRLRVPVSSSRKSSPESSALPPVGDTRRPGRRMWATMRPTEPANLDDLRLRLQSVGRAGCRCGPVAAFRTPQQAAQLRRWLPRRQDAREDQISTPDEFRPWTRAGYVHETADDVELLVQQVTLRGSRHCRTEITTALERRVRYPVACGPENLLALSARSTRCVGRRHAGSEPPAPRTVRHPAPSCRRRLFVVVVIEGCASGVPREAADLNPHGRRREDAGCPVDSAAR